MKDRSSRPLAALGMGGHKNMKKLHDAATTASTPAPMSDDEDSEVYRGRSGKGGSAKPRREVFVNSNWVTQSQKTDIRGLLKYCKENYSGLSDWEQEFVDDITDFFERKRGLTVKQYDKLTDIVDRN